MSELEKLDLGFAIFLGVGFILFFWGMCGAGMEEAKRKWKERQ
jgi:hypothetical protein